MSTPDIIERNDNGKITHVKSSDGVFECWYEYNEKGDVVTPKTKNRVETLQSNLESLTTSLRVMIETYMKNDGDKECDSQRICLLNRLNDLEYTINGIQQEDLKGND